MGENIQEILEDVRDRLHSWREWAEEANDFPNWYLLKGMVNRLDEAIKQAKEKGV
jgi:hypothetical protein